MRPAKRHTLFPTTLPKRCVQGLLAVLLCAIGAAIIILPRLHTEATPPPPGSHRAPAALTAENVQSLLRGVQDPALDISIVDLGLVRSVAVEGARVQVVIVFTSPFCPLRDVIINAIEDRLSPLAGASRVDVIVDRSILWSPDLATEAGRRKLEGLLLWH